MPCRGSTGRISPSQCRPVKDSLCFLSTHHDRRSSVTAFVLYEAGRDTRSPMSLSLLYSLMDHKEAKTGRGGKDVCGQTDAGQPGTSRHRLVPVSSHCQISHLTRSWPSESGESLFRRDSTVCGVMGGTG